MIPLGVATVKVAVSLDEETVREVDALVQQHAFPSRSRAIQEALAEKLIRLSRSRLAEQCKLLDPDEEKDMAEEFSPNELELWQNC